MIAKQIVEDIYIIPLRMVNAYLVVSDSLTKLAALNFEIACFGHGNPITGGAAGRFREKWGAG